MNKKKNNNQEIIIGFLVLIAFIISVCTAILSHRTDRIEYRIEYIEKTANNNR